MARASQSARRTTNTHRIQGARRVTARTTISGSGQTRTTTVRTPKTASQSAGAARQLKQQRADYGPVASTRVVNMEASARNARNSRTGAPQRVAQPKRKGGGRKRAPQPSTEQMMISEANRQSRAAQARPTNPDRPASSQRVPSPSGGRAPSPIVRSASGGWELRGAQTRDRRGRFA